jgi:hypothetical protein
VEHELEAFSVRPVKLKEVKGDEIVVTGEKVPEVVWCRVCGMPVDEIIDTPCPGRRVKDIIAELTEGLEFPDA